MRRKIYFFPEDIIKPIVILVLILAVSITVIYFTYTEVIVRGIDNAPNYQDEYVLTESAVAPEAFRLQKNFRNIILEFDIIVDKDAAEEPCLSYVVTKDGVPQITYDFKLAENVEVDHIYTKISYYQKKSQIIFHSEYYQDGKKIGEDGQYTECEIAIFSDVFLNTVGEHVTISGLEFRTGTGKDTPNETLYMVGIFVVFFICLGVLIAMFPISNALQESVDGLFHHLSAQVAALGLCVVVISLFSYNKPELVAMINNEYIKGFFGFGLGLDKIGSSLALTLTTTIVGVVLVLSQLIHNSQKYNLGFGYGLLVSVVMLISGMCRLIAVFSLGLLTIAFLFWLLSSLGTIIGIILLIAFFVGVAESSDSASTYSYFAEDKEKATSKEEKEVRVWRENGYMNEYMKVSSDGERYFDPEDGEWHRINK